MPSDHGFLNCNDSLFPKAPFPRHLPPPISNPKSPFPPPHLSSRYQSRSRSETPQRLLSGSLSSPPLDLAIDECRTLAEVAAKV
ncbi:hypothetical protein Sjap_022617 [Stephania japonica]|uniref:Uncharacterized protein n=1 Tax=Stephania japonica TaxID=461633 RepID=A0AAP0EP76_9MAGN